MKLTLTITKASDGIHDYIQVLSGDMFEFIKHKQDTLAGGIEQLAQRRCKIKKRGRSREKFLTGTDTCVQAAQQTIIEILLRR